MGQISSIANAVGLQLGHVLAGAPAWVGDALAWLQRENRGFLICLGIEIALLLSLGSRVIGQLVLERRAKTASTEHSRKIVLRGQISAADQGSSRAQHRLARMYAQGQDVKKDFVQAHMWFSLAAAGGIKEAAESLASIARQMTPDQIAKAEEMAAKRRRSGD
ncbi:MAG TPA: SEL1-like repeat protein [Candidatus Udaeobacter sp.]|nr:SEL1-like repeat protein [Candidatus Udaeobacter sp.]